jgi:hypothetical protein
LEVRTIVGLGVGVWRRAGDGPDLAGGLDADVGVAALAEEHVYDLAGGAVAEELAELLFVVGDAVGFDEVDEVLGGVAGKG